MNALNQLQKYERLAEIAHKMGCYKCARKWSIKAEKLEAVINVLEKVEKEIKQVELVQLQGSEKQVAWASSIREDKIKAIRELAEKDSSVNELVEQAIEWLSQKLNSKWWIENRSNPGSAFFAYANYQANSTEKLELNFYQLELNFYQLELNFYQSATLVGGQTQEKLIPAVVFCIKNNKDIESVGIKRTLHKDGNLDCEIGKIDELKDEVSTCLDRLIDITPGGLTQDLDAVIVRCFKTRDRIGGEDITVWAFVKVKEFAKIG